MFQPIHNHVDAVFKVLFEQPDLFEFKHLSIHSNSNKPFARETVENLPMLAFPISNNGSKDQESLPRRVIENRINDLLCTLPTHRRLTHGATGFSPTGIEQSEIIIDLRDGPDGGAWIARCTALLDRNRWREPLNAVDIGFRLLV
jgi:hypothetical protein